MSLRLPFFVVKLQTVMNMIEYELKRLIKDSKSNENLKNTLLETRNSDDPMKDFCEVCQSFGYEIYLGELFSYGQDMNDSKLRATNGGGSFAIEGWDDILEDIFQQLNS